MKSLLPLVVLGAALAMPASASAWSPLRGENSNAKKGNALMAKEQYGPALEAYDEAARELPKVPEVQVNRGLALLGHGLSEQSKEAFVAATDPSASPSTRADAYYDLGIAFAREGDSLSQQEEFEQASTHFREAADASKRSLRLRPGDRNAAWNLEYALKRIREEEEKQQQQQQQDQEQQEQDQEQQEQDQEQQQDQEQDGEQGQEQQDQEQQQDQEEPQQDESGNEGEEESQGESASEQQEPQPVPRDEVERFLDALEQNEQNLPLERARRRSAGRPPPEKDW